MQDEIVDLSQLGKQGPNIFQLYEDEELALRASPRCPVCNRLGLFHQWVFDMEQALRFLICVLLPIGSPPCATEHIIDV